MVYLRTLDDADRLAKQLRKGDPLVVLGGGFIGCEVAAAARRLGVEVTVLEMAPVPLEQALGRQLGGLVADIHREAGVDFRTDERVQAVSETADGLLVRSSPVRRPSPRTAYEHSLQSVGFDDGCDEVVVRGSVADRSFAQFSLSGGRVRAVVALDRGRDVIAGRKLISSGAQVSAEALSHESNDLRRLCPSGPELMAMRADRTAAHVRCVRAR